jgi:hypothetical protein
MEGNYFHPKRSPAQTSDCKRAALLDNPISAKEQTVGDFLSERIGSFQINDQRELGGLLNRKIRRFGALQNLIYVACCALN